MVGDWGEVV